MRIFTTTIRIRPSTVDRTQVRSFMIDTVIAENRSGVAKTSGTKTFDKKLAKNDIIKDELIRDVNKVNVDETQEMDESKRKKMQILVEKSEEIKQIEYDANELIEILSDIKPIIQNEPSLLEIPLPCIIVGDIHGQYDDLQRIFMITGDKTRNGITMHRFYFSVITLIAFYLLRGNHESSFINRHYGFYQELIDRYDEELGNKLWYLFNDIFDLLPIAALIHKRILCMHGGLSPHLNSLDDIRKIVRPIKTMEESPLVCDLLWSDPVINLTGFVKNIIRGVSVCFGEDTVLKTCEKLNLDIIVRAHQNNKGAIMIIDKNMKAGFLILHPVTPDARGQQTFVDSYTHMSAETGYISKEVLSGEKEITTYDPIEVYDAEKMKSQNR
ncbi:Serine/threonine-protein phosphatase [Dirofilaria immitis]|nr:Serine/threonine-protein phosphatase [Dirofilaria immitis]